MASPRLTIGMAVFDDFDGAYFTLQSLRMNNDLSEVELVVIDNNPNSSHGKELANLCLNWIGAKYIPMTENVGTTQPRNAVFDNASGDAVMCMDSHVLLYPGTIQRLLNFYASNPDTLDLYSGPIILDNLNNFSTQYNDVWRAEMWGIWGNAWECCKGGLHFSGVENQSDNSKVQYIALREGYIPVTHCSKCKKVLPDLPYAGHQNRLKEFGYKSLGENPNDLPFEIPGQGLGLFTCRKEAWQSIGGFNKDFRGFGGEEMYIHTKFRQNNRKNYCLPFLKWLHRFARPNGIKFPLTRWNKVRNYVLGANELGLSLEPIYNHFVKTNLFSEQEWQHLNADPVKHTTGLITNAVGQQECGTCGKPAAIPDEIKNAKGVADLFAYTLTQPRDLEKHFDKLIELALKCDYITEITKRKESTIAFATTNPQKHVSYNLEANTPIIHKLQTFTKDLQISIADSTKIESIEETDLLFIDSQHTANMLVSELDKFAKSVSRFIVMRGTQANGEIGEDGGPGLLPAMRKFLKENQEWSVVYHSQEQYGLTVLSKLAEDKPALPSIFTRAANFAKAVTEHVASGALKIDLPTYEKRLDTCSICPQRNDGNCSVCGCVISAKASWETSICPLGNW